jgi:hypothetical protein
MQIAQSSISPLNVWSATAELPREARNRRISDTWATELAVLAAWGAVSAAGAAVVSSFLRRISDKGELTFMKLKFKNECSVNGLRNQAHTFCIPVTLR